MSPLDNRRFVGRWLKQVSVPTIQWNISFAELFENFFGRSHLSLRCLSKSVFLSISLGLAVFLCQWSWSTKNSILNGIMHHRDRLPELMIMIAFMVTNIVSDYLSLWKTRTILTRIGDFSKQITLVGVVFADFVLTTLLYMASAFISFLLLALFAMITRISDGDSLDVVDLLRNIFQGMFALDRSEISNIINTLNLFYLISLLTSAWPWSYVVTSTLMRCFLIYPSTIRLLSRIADLDEHPVRTIGFAAGLVSAGVVVLSNLFLG